MAQPLFLTLHSWLQVVVRLGLGGVFLWSGIQKFLHLALFYQAAHNYDILPYQWTHIYAVMVPWLEVMCGVYLLVGLFLRFAAFMTSGLLVSFIIAIGMVLMRGDAVDCGCFLGGANDHAQVSMGLLWRDVSMLAAAVYVMVTTHTRLCVDQWLRVEDTHG